MRLQSKILALVVPTALLAAGLLLALIHRSVHAIVLDSVRRGGQAAVEAALPQAAPAFALKSEPGLLPLLQGVQARSAAVYAAALDPDGLILAHTDIVERGKSRRDARTLSALRAPEPSAGPRDYRGEALLEISVPVRVPGGPATQESFLFSGKDAPPGETLGLIAVGLSLAPAVETRTRILREAALLVAAIGGLALAVLLIFIRRLLRPVGGMMDAIAQVGQGRFLLRVPAPSDDEFGELARSFNAMSEALARTTFSKDYVENILENMPDILFVADESGRIRTANPAAAAALGYAPAELPGLPLAALLHGAPQPFKGKTLEAALAGGGLRDLELELRTKAGARIPALLSASALRDRDGRLSGFLAVAKDIGERKRAEDALRAAKSAAEASNKELESFSYSVAHDLRAPLRAIDSFSLVLLARCADKLDAEGRELFSRVRAASQRMARLIDDLLKLSRLTRATMQSEKVDLSALARGIAAELRKSDPARRVRFIVADGLCDVGDPVLLRAALENLFGNAWKYSRKHPRATIEFAAAPCPAGPPSRAPSGRELAPGAAPETGRRAYVIRDDGAGFDMAFAHKLFHPFSRLHADREFEGSGIGLATARRVIERHGGRIRGEGQVEKGATFTFTLWEAPHEEKDDPAGGR